MLNSRSKIQRIKLVGQGRDYHFGAIDISEHIPSSIKCVSTSAATLYYAIDDGAAVAIGVGTTITLPTTYTTLHLRADITASGYSQGNAEIDLIY